MENQFDFRNRLEQELFNFVSMSVTRDIRIIDKLFYEQEATARINRSEFNKIKIKTGC